MHIINSGLNQVKDNFMVYDHYYHKDILDQLNEHIDKGIETFDEIEDFYKDKIVATCVRIFNETECITETYDNHITLHHLSKFIETANPQYALDLAETLKKVTFDYFYKSLCKIYEEWREARVIENYRERGLKSSIDQSTGEVKWVSNGTRRMR